MIEALRLDEQRSATLRCLSLAAAGQGDRVHASWLGTAFGDLGPTVTHAQRALWRAAEARAYGPAGVLFIRKRLTSASRPDGWLDVLAPAMPAQAPPSLSGIDAVTVPLAAGDRLRRLRARCETILAGNEPVPADDDLTGWDEPVGTPMELLLEDVAKGSRLALMVGAGAVRKGASDLADAAIAPPPAEVAVWLSGHLVTVRPGGPDADSMEPAQRSLRRGGRFWRRRQPQPEVDHVRLRACQAAQALAFHIHEAPARSAAARTHLSVILQNLACRVPCPPG